MRRPSAGTPAQDSTDSDDWGKLEVTDANHSFGYPLLGGPEPALPFPGCGIDPTADGLGYWEPPACAEQVQRRYQDEKALS